MIKRNATTFSPNLVLTNSYLDISGKLWMENAQTYFADVFSNTLKCSAKHFNVNIDVEHLNSSSIKQLLLYFILLKEMVDERKFESIQVNWNISEDDYDLKEVIQDLAQVSEIKIEIRDYKPYKMFSNL